MRGILYRFEIFKTEKVPVKIISVGNITLGGTGKTPFVITLAGILEEELKKNVSVLIRGYGWDEQAMLKKKLPDIPVLVGEDRARSAHKAIRLYGSDTAILDDGFQHWELGRDLDIVLIDSRNPFGNGHLFPRGILREPKTSLKRADVIVFTKVDNARRDLKGLKEELENINGKALFLEAVHVPKYLYENRTDKHINLSYAAGKRVILVSSIGDGAYFEETIRGLKAEIAEHIIFGDHHDYKQGDIDRILKRCEERAFDAIITTEKDAVKLRRMHFSFGRFTLWTLAVEIEIVNGKEMLVDRLNSLYIRKNIK